MSVSTQSPGHARSSASLVVGVRIPSWATFTRHIFEGILEHVRLHRERWQIRTMVESTSEIAPVVIDERWSGDGLIVFRPAARELRAWQARKIPVVNLSSESLGLGVPTVIPDNALAGQLAAKHLLELGLKRFAFWGDPSRLYSRQRGKSFAAELEKRGFNCRPMGFEISKLPAAKKWEKVRAEMLKQLAEVDLPIGVFARDDIAAAALTSACSQLGLVVPDQVAVIGCNDDVTFCHTASPPLSSVQYPGKEIGQTAARLLSQMMRSAEPVEELTLVKPRKVVARESTDVLAFADPVVTEALRIIRRESPRSALQVADVISRLPISRASFQQRFREAVGHSPKQEIDRVRIDRASQLLVTTDWPIKEIAYEMQFESSEEFSRFLRRQLGTCATDIRKSNRGR
ncbi:MAG: DNA-binding transcriptional regulator [Verrucomicrobiae bacterium]|nr:DNA-binding transcriptional regulator [Verrucomicrobiae bacterium]